MKRYGLFILFTFLAAFSHAQIDGLGKDRDLIRNRGNRDATRFNPRVSDSTTRSGKTAKRKLKTYPLRLYRLYDWKQDTLVTDTLLDIDDFHRANFTEKDLYYGQPFQNIGEPVNRLLGTERRSFLPLWTPVGKRPSEMRRRDLRFAFVPTPLSRLFFLTGNGQGQMLHTHFHINIFPHWNLNFGYHGLSSLGYYRHSLSQNENWFINTHYRDSLRRWSVKAYILKNILLNEENGGILDESFFENPGDTYVDRGKIPVRSQNGKSLWKARREGGEWLWSPFKSLPQWSLGYEFDYTKAYFSYEGMQADFGPLQPYSKKFDSIATRDYRHTVMLQYAKGAWEGRLLWLHWRAFRRFDTTVTANGMTVPASTLWRENFAGAQWGYHTNKWKTSGKWMAGNNGHYSGALNGMYTSGKHSLEAGLNISKHRPEPKFILWQSRYIKYNWHYHWDDEEKMSASVLWKSPFGRLKLDHTGYKNYTYFGTDSLPHQHPGSMSVTAVTYGKDWQWKYGGVYPEFTWQQVSGGGDALDLPRYRGRLTLYYKDHWFTNHMYLNMGIRLSGFSSWFMPAYVPATGEFVQQRTQRYGNFYLADFFFNFQVKKFYAYLVLEHFNAYWERRHPAYYSAPYQPYADQTIRLGIVWKFVN